MLFLFLNFVLAAIVDNSVYLSDANKTLCSYPKWKLKKKKKVAYTGSSFKKIKGLWVEESLLVGEFITSLSFLFKILDCGLPEQLDPYFVSLKTLGSG